MLTENMHEEKAPRITDTAIGIESSVHDGDNYHFNSKKQNKQAKKSSRRSFPWFQFVSNFFFLAASSMYMWMAVEDFRWSHESKQFPVYLRPVLDDELWQEYRWEQWRTGGVELIIEEEAESSPETSKAEGSLENMEKGLNEEEKESVETKDPTVFYDYWWADLPPETQDGYAVLGYDENSWNNGLPVAVEELGWDEMSLEQQNAATFLGYTKLMWDGPEANYDDYDWDELPADIKEAASVLGYNRNMWDNGIEAETDDYWWRELSEEQQEAAALLGYDENSWDGTTVTTSINENGETVVSTTKTENFDDFHLWEDDYLFPVAGTNVWVSDYQTVYFFAALLFVVVGLMDWICERIMYHTLMIIAGLSGLVAAIFVHGDPYISNVFSTISVHFFFLEAIKMLLDRNTMRAPLLGGKGIKQNLLMKVLAFANFMFIIGAGLDVVLSYFWLLDSTAEWDSGLNVSNIIAATAWLVCPVIYFSSTLYVYFTYSDDVTDTTSDDSCDLEVAETFDDSESDSQKYEGAVPSPSLIVDN